MNVKNWMRQQYKNVMKKEVQFVLKKIKPGDKLDIYCTGDISNLSICFSKIENGRIYGTDQNTHEERSCPLELITKMLVNHHRP